MESKLQSLRPEDVKREVGRGRRFFRELLDPQVCPLTPQWMTPEPERSPRYPRSVHLKRKSKTEVGGLAAPPRSRANAIRSGPGAGLDIVDARKAG